MSDNPSIEINLTTYTDMLGVLFLGMGFAYVASPVSLEIKWISSMLTDFGDWLTDLGDWVDLIEFGNQTLIKIVVNIGTFF
jgi:hypothetical protein